MTYTVVWSECGQPSAEGMALREEVFIKEQHFPYDKDACDDLSYHVTLYCGKFCGATGRIYPEHGGGYHAGRIAVKKDYRGLGIGRGLMEELCQKAKELGGTRLVVGAQLQARGFYERCGFVPKGEVYREDGVDHIMMEKIL